MCSLKKLNRTEAVGISPMSVGRIWADAGLKPHIVKGFKVSNDPMFEEKVTEIVGLYLDPPDRAVVLCGDEKSQIQALDRTSHGCRSRRVRLNLCDVGRLPRCQM
jgi:hypothetical protein